jgi:hypothetical protein
MHEVGVDASGTTFVTDFVKISQLVQKSKLGRDTEKMMIIWDYFPLC